MTYLAVGGSSTGSTSTLTPLEALGGHRLLPGECVPVKGPVWVYPGPSKTSSDLYESFATNYSCRAAAAWTTRFAAATIPVKRTGAPSNLAGPPGFTCIGWPDANDHAYGGSCRRGMTRVEFGWNWNVVNRRVALEPDANGDGGEHVAKPSRDDAGTLITMLGSGRYELEVQNTSGIGDIDNFTWAPPAGWTVTAVTGSSGNGKCSLASDGSISCSGDLQHPTCLCTDSGGALIIQFTAGTPGPARAHGHPITYAMEGGSLQIRAMTPVPYLIPDTPNEARRSSGV